MANKKYYLISKFESEEDFDRHFNSIYNSGYEKGYSDGMEEALSYVFEMLDHFSRNMQQNAAHMNEKRQQQRALECMKHGIVNVQMDDPAMREHKQEINRKMESKEMIKRFLKTVEENNKES